MAVTRRSMARFKRPLPPARWDASRRSYWPATSAALTDLSGVHDRQVHDRPPKMIILDMDSSVNGEQEAPPTTVTSFRSFRGRGAVGSQREGVLPVVVRYKGRNVRCISGAMPPSPRRRCTTSSEGFLYAIRLPKNQVLQESVAHLLTRPVGRPPNQVLRFYASFSYRAGSWDKKRRVVAKVEWHPGELVPRVGFIVTNLSRSAERVTWFYNQRGKAEQYIKEGKNAIKWTRLSCRVPRQCRSAAASCAYNLATSCARLCRRRWSTGIGAKVVRHVPIGRGAAVP